MKKINGDKINGLINKILYFPQCLIDQKCGDNKYIKIDNPTLSTFDIKTHGKTPSRILCEAFWNSIDYENVEIQLGSKLNFFDIGCGSGHHGELYKNLSKQSYESYTGLDTYKHDQFPLKFNHIMDKAENISQYINKKINFVTSQSSLEHIEKDILVIEELTKKLTENKEPFIQIHMLPASKALWLYLFHGYRQYSKKNLANITSNLQKKFQVNSSIVPIGGSNSFWTHLKFITLPVFAKILIKDKNFRWYNQKNIEKKIINSISGELNCRSKSPVFWALIISSKNINLKHKKIKII